jgi:uncharacterized protein (DUF4415 family)
MKNKEKDFEYLETPPEFLKRGMRLITRPKSLDKALKASRDMKSRITIYLDADIVIKFKEIADEQKAGYQTLINDALRTIVDAMAEESEKENLKEDILKDKKFLRRLKVAMSV